ncbi:flavin monoamine oxidase family protein [Kaistella antarctica]|uniref:Amine oxidase n=1 Tax=Kaistella antarctica TaxID=266748 RepID=A0A3S4YPC3_9FLAO|nr:NAD(P)/FAD-dependent oxidoreductase [Kaistella antarctica]KEY20083.1 amine oxidase [Kaistella antarctica]SEV93911.1 monoamine oxidase [Kaistella antarctica]VEH95405.1 Putrescine oxidase [Kaistella antarctica]
MVIIIGAGLSGLLTAFRLKKQGIPFKILEARNRIGGRINTVLESNNTPVEMGATWFQNNHQNLIALLKELGLNGFEQFMDETVLFQQQANSPIQLMEIGKQAPSYRIAGGTSNLINALFQTLRDDEVLLNQTVTKIIFKEDSIQVYGNEIFAASQVVLAIPPKLWANKILFEPNLARDLMDVAQQTHTWMEDSIKVALTYKEPFWQDDDQPGTFFSNAGPITEFYDHCNIERTKFALCGFINSAFKNFPHEERQNLVINQLKSVFGQKVESFLDYEEGVWSEEEYTFARSEYDVFPHQNNGNTIFNQPLFNDRLFISSSEVSAESPGYMEGAVYAGNVIAEKLISFIK